MNKIFTLAGFSKKVASLKKQGKIVLVGGCFDVLHPGHIVFLQKAKEAGRYLVILLESDGKIKKLKGESRPVHNQEERALILSAISAVDFVVLLPDIESDTDYDVVVSLIKPDIIATTFGDKGIDHKNRAAGLIGAEVKYVTKMVGSYSTTKILTR